MGEGVGKLLVYLFNLKLSVDAFSEIVCSICLCVINFIITNRRNTTPPWGSNSDTTTTQSDTPAEETNVNFISKLQYLDRKSLVVAGDAQIFFLNNQKDQIIK